MELLGFLYSISKVEASWYMLPYSLSIANVWGVYELSHKQ